MTEADTDDVARAHQACFEGYFLTQLGPAFLRRYYAEFCRHASDYRVVARCRATQHLAAFVVGTSDAQTHFRSFYRRNMLVILPIVVLRFFTNRLVRGKFRQRMAHVKVALGALLPGTGRRGRVSPDDSDRGSHCPVRLLSIAVTPEFRGSGVAAAVGACFEDMLRRDGHKRVGLSVLPDNQRAISFYKKVGWEVTHRSPAGRWFEKDL